MIDRFVGLAASFCLLVIAAPLSAQTLTQDPSHLPSGTYQLEPRHSQLLFSVRHLGLTDFYGRFDRLSGSLDFNSAQPEKSSVNVTIDMNSLDMPVPKMAAELEESSVFNTAKYPTATFKSTSIVRTGPTTGTMTGELTMLGITKPVSLNVVFNGGGANPMSKNAALGFEATGTIKRSDFELTPIWSAAVSDQVNLIISAAFEQEQK